MESDLNIQYLLQSKNEILDKILQNIKSWNGEIESGINLIETNQNYIVELAALNEKLSKSPITSTHDKEYENKLNLIIDEQKRLILSLKEKQDDLRDSIQQINKKDKVIKNYIDTDREPIFIDKKLY